MIDVDNKSISYGEDGDLSGILHLQNFHNDSANTTTLANSDLVLRTKSNDGNYLEYMTFDTFNEWLTNKIDLQIAENDDGEGGGGSSSEDIDNINNELDELQNKLDNLTTGGCRYDKDSNTISEGAIMVGRKAYKIPSVKVNTSGPWTISVYVSGNSVTITWVNEDAFSKTPTITTCWIPMYTFTSELEVENDYRGATTVPIYD